MEIIEYPADILNAIRRGYTVEWVEDGWMWLSRPSAKQLALEKEGYYFEHPLL